MVGDSWPEFHIYTDSTCRSSRPPALSSNFLAPVFTLGNLDAPGGFRAAEGEPREAAAEARGRAVDRISGARVARG